MIGNGIENFTPAADRCPPVEATSIAAHKPQPAVVILKLFFLGGN